MLRYAIRQFDGEGSLAARGEQIGRQWGAQIARLLDGDIATSRERQDIVTFDDGSVSVRVLVVDIGRDRTANLWIAASGGCADVPPFLLKYEGTVPFAYYTDGRRERIYTAGTRPNPDPSVRTKNVVLPTDVTTGLKRGSKYSGLMRMAVQCSHARGANTKFAFGWAKTHGILEHIDQAPLNDGAGASATTAAAAQRYWVVEISPDGAFAAPVEWSGRCCDGFSVDAYLPTPAQVKAAPALQTYRDTLSLAWAFGQRIKGVAQVLTPAQVAPAYVGSPWKSDDGWAFSRSGKHAQNVTARQVGLHFHMERWKVDFTTTLSGQNYVVTAVIARAEQGDIYFPSTDPLWIPTGNGAEWMPAPRFSGVDIASASGPVHVYYQGETEFVTRYAHSGSAATIPTNSYGSANAHHMSCPMRVDDVPGGSGSDVYICAGTILLGKQYAQASAANWTRELSFNGVTSGYTNPNGTTAGATMTSGNRVIESWRSYPAGKASYGPLSGSIFACCGTGVFGLTYYTDQGLSTDFRSRDSSTYGHYSACILLPDEREGILLLSKLIDIGTENDRTDVSNGYYEDSWYAILDPAHAPYGPPAPCWSDVGGVGGRPGSNFHNDQPPSSTSSSSFSYSDTSATYSMALGTRSLSGAMTLTAAIDKAFVSQLPPVPLVLLGFQAMHGGMAYAPLDPAAEQPKNFPPLQDQTGNAIVRFPGSMQTFGGFVNDENGPNAFVGQA